MSKREPSLLVEDIIESANKILDYTEGFTFEGFIKDSKTIDAVIKESYLPSLIEALKSL